METLGLTVLKDIANIIVYAIAIIGSFYSFIKWVWPRLSPYFYNQIYLHQTGTHIIRDIEKQFGKEAGRVIKDLLKEKGLEIVIDEMRLNIIENAIGLGIYICSSDGKCTYANKTLAKMFGLSQTEMLGNGWLKPIINKQEAHSNWKRSVEYNIPYEDTYELKVDGEIKKYHTQAEPSMDEDRTVILGYVGTVRELKIESNKVD